MHETMWLELLAEVDLRNKWECSEMLGGRRLVHLRGARGRRLTYESRGSDAGHLDLSLQLPSTYLKKPLSQRRNIHS